MGIKRRLAKFYLKIYTFCKIFFGPGGDQNAAISIYYDQINIRAAFEPILENFIFEYDFKGAIYISDSATQSIIWLQIDLRILIKCLDSIAFNCQVFFIPDSACYYVIIQIIPQQDDSFYTL